jgi:tRNA threonylcarbamoyladenosine biosynthesis protein TsaB
MKILAIDTATEACSVALMDSAEYHTSNEIDKSFDSIFEICPQQHSQQILPMIDKLLKRNACKLSELDAIAYGRGPGSFTGVRIAASTVQGLAFGANLPVVHVSTLAAMAQQEYANTGRKEHLVLIDARMKEVYMGHYKIVDGVAVQQVEESVVAPESALAYLMSLPEDIGLAGTGYITYAEIFAQSLQNVVLNVHYPHAAFMLPCAVQAMQKGSSIVVDDINPIYVRDKVTWQKLPHKM